MENKFETSNQDAKKQLNGKSPISADPYKRSESAIGDSHFADNMAERYESAKKATTAAYDTSIEQVKQSPLLSMAAAVGVGALAGYFMGRRK